MFMNKVMRVSVLILSVVAIQSWASPPAPGDGQTESGLKLNVGLSFTVVEGIPDPQTEAYDINFDRKVKIGDSYDLKVTGSQVKSVKMTSEGAEIQNESSNVEVTFTGVYTILQLDEDGEVSAFKLDVESFFSKAEGITLPIASKGDVVKISKRGEEGSLTLNGKAFPAETRGLVDIVFDAPDDGASDEDIFGTTERKKVGDKWPMNMKLAREELLAERGVDFDPANSEGTVEFKKVAKVSGIDALTLEMSMDLSGVKGLVPLPKGFKIDKSNATFSMTGTYPLNTRLEAVSSNMNGSITFTGSGKLGPAGSETPHGTMEIAITSKRTISQSPTFLN